MMSPPSHDVILRRLHSQASCKLVLDFHLKDKSYKTERRIDADIMKTIIAFSVFVAFFDGFQAQTQSNCRSRDQNPYLHFASKTAYEFVNYDISTEVHIPGCEPVHFWLLARHGTRYPSKKVIGEMKDKLPQLQRDIINNFDDQRSVQLCSEDLELLRRWHVSFDRSNASMLAPQGFQDMNLLAKRYQGRFPNLLAQAQYRPIFYKFQHTNSSRTQDSALAFAEGLFGRSTRVTIPPGIDNDPLLKRYGNCTVWENDVENGEENLKEYHDFEDGDLIQALVYNVSSRLGFTYNLTIKEIDLMFEACRFDKALNIEETSAWCSVFTKNELQILEYAEDLKYYYESGYGNDFNKRLGCPLVNDFMQRFRNIVQGKSEPLGVFYFAHSTTIQTLVTTLGIENDDKPLLKDNFRQQYRRQWKTSLIDPFAANVAVVLFNCSDGYKTIFYLQEKPYSFEGQEGCNSYICDWTAIEKKYSDVADNCENSLRHCEPGYSKASLITISNTVHILVLSSLVWLLTYVTFEGPLP